MWNFLVVRDNTNSGHRARSIIIDCLSTLGYKFRGITTDRKYLRLRVDPGRANHYANVDPGPGPTTNANVPVPSLDRYLQGNILTSIPLDVRRTNEEYLSAQWQKLHRYQGFFAIEHDPFAAAGAPQFGYTPLRGIPVPEGPDSLWHAISYWRGGRRP